MRLLRQAVVLSAIALTAGAQNRIEVEPRTVRVDDSFEIVVTLQGEAAASDSIELPLQNAKIDAGPSTASRFSWVNGVTRREKTFRYSAHALREGRAVVGPVKAGPLAIPAVAITVLPSIAQDVSTPEEMADLLEEAGRSSAFIIGEASTREAYVGEPILLTWSLYIDELVSDLEVDSMPELSGFWSEELPIAQEPTRDVLVGDRRMRKIPIRRVALFPLRPGELKVGSLVTTAAVMRPIGRRSNPFSILNQEIGTLTLRAPSRTFSIRPLPPGRFDAVGTFTIRCQRPRVAVAGPVAMEVFIEGNGNLRAAGQPRFETAPAARVEVVDGLTTVDRQTGSLTMLRNWKFLLFPQHSGRLAIPPLEFRTFVPARGETSMLRCGSSVVAVNPVAGSSRSPVPLRQPAARARTRLLWPWVAAGAALLAVAFVVLRPGRARVSRGDLERVLSLFEQPRAMRTSLYELVAERGLSVEALLREASERGDAFRAVQSLIDIAEKETLTGDVSARELKRRLARFLKTIR